MRVLEVRPGGPGTSAPAPGPDAGADVWYRDWVCAGVEAQIPAGGDLLPTTLGDLATHVQRLPDGGLLGGFNALQHGSCWTVPAQCRSGHKIRCPYVSCAFSLDTDAIPAIDGAPAPRMRQFTGGSPGRLHAVPTATLGPLIFVSVAEPVPPSLAAQVGGAVAAAGVDLDGLVYLTRTSLELDCRWDAAPDRVRARLADARAVPALGPGGSGPAPRATPVPPNAVIVALRDHVAVVVVKTAGPQRCQAMVALFARDGDDLAAVDERMRSGLRAGWEDLLGA